MAKWAIVDVRAGTKQGPTGTLVPTKVIRYTVDGHGPFEVELDNASFTPDHVTAALDKDAATFAALNIPPKPGAGR